MKQSSGRSFDSGTIGDSAAAGGVTRHQAGEPVLLATNWNSIRGSLYSRSRSVATADADRTGSRDDLLSAPTSRSRKETMAEPSRSAERHRGRDGTRGHRIASRTCCPARGTRAARRPFPYTKASVQASTTDVNRKGTGVSKQRHAIVRSLDCLFAVAGPAHPRAFAGNALRPPPGSQHQRRRDT
jgi:hypothetical protein